VQFNLDNLKYGVRAIDVVNHIHKTKKIVKKEVKVAS